MGVFFDIIFREGSERFYIKELEFILLKGIYIHLERNLL